MHIGAGEGDEEGVVARSTLGCTAVVVVDVGDLVEGIEQEG